MRTNISSHIPNIGVIGTGNRFFQYYTEILNYLSDHGQIKITGVYNRTGNKATRAAELLKTQVFSSLDELLVSSDINCVFNLVRGEAKYIFAKRILNSGKHLYLETPAASSSHNVRILSTLADEHGLNAQVAEDAACLPEAQIQRDIIVSGILGPVQAVINDESAYANHGFARAQAILGKFPHARSFWHVSAAGATSYDLFGINFSGGIQYFQRFPDPKNHISRYLGHWKIVCRDGVLDDNGIIMTNPKGSLDAVAFNTHGSTGGGLDDSIGRISILIKGKEFLWQAEPGTVSWSRKQQAVYFLVKDFINAISRQKSVAYSIKDATDPIVFWRINKMLAKIPIPVHISASPLLAFERILW